MKKSNLMCRRVKGLGRWREIFGIQLNMGNHPSFSSSIRIKSTNPTNWLQEIHFENEGCDQPSLFVSRRTCRDSSFVFILFSCHLQTEILIAVRSRLEAIRENKGVVDRSTAPGSCQWDLCLMGAYENEC